MPETVPDRLERRRQRPVGQRRVWRELCVVSGVRRELCVVCVCVCVVCVGRMREYMRLWNSCVSSGVILRSVGRRKEKVGQRGTSSGCGGYPWISEYVSRNWRRGALFSSGMRIASWKSSRSVCWVAWTSAS